MFYHRIPNCMQAAKNQSANIAPIAATSASAIIMRRALKRRQPPTAKTDVVSLALINQQSQPNQILPTSHSIAKPYNVDNLLRPLDLSPTSPPPQRPPPNPPPQQTEMCKAGTCDKCRTFAALLLPAFYFLIRPRNDSS